MPRALKLHELRRLTDQELEGMYNATTENVVVGLEWFREEVNARAARRQTRAIIWLTIAITVLTAANVAVAAALLLRAT